MVRSCSQTKSNAAVERKVRNRAYMLMVAGIIVVMLGYGRLLTQVSEATGTIPVVLALLGFAISTIGFCSFAGYEKRSRLTYSLRSPVFDTYTHYDMGFDVPGTRE